MRMPSEEEWVGWLQLPQTQVLQQLAAARRRDLMEAWAAGSFGDDVGLNMKALGECQAYLLIMELDYESTIKGQIGETDEQ